MVDPVFARMADTDPSQGFRSMADLWGAENVSDVTLRQLLGMTSGLPDFDTATPCFPNQTGCVPSDPLRKTLYDDPGTSYEPARLMDVPWVGHHWRGQCKQVIRPGMAPFCYSSTNFMLLGFVLVAMSGATSWETLDQMAFVPESLKGKLAFALSGSPRDYTRVHGYDRTSYNVPKGQTNDHDNWQVHGVFSGWTASDMVAPASAIADLTWEVYGPEHRFVPQEVVELMLPGPLDIYGLATFNLRTNTGRLGRLGKAHGHLGATYGYQSVTAYFPGLQIAMTVATNIETDYQEQPAHAMCLAYNAAVNRMLNETTQCEFKPGSYYGGGCHCKASSSSDESVVLMV